MPPSLFWNLPFFTVEFTLSSSCSRSDFLLSCQGAALAHLDSFPPQIWYSGQTALILFHLARVALAYLPTALSVALRPHFPLQQVQFVLVFPLKPAPFCKRFAGLGSTNKSATSLLFSYYLTLVLSSPPCPLLHLSSYLKLSSRSGRSCLLSFPALSGCNGSPHICFSRGTKRLMGLTRRGALLAPSAIPCSLSPLISCIHSCLFSNWRRTVSSKFFDTQVPSISTEEQLVLPRHARCVLSRLRCNGHSLRLGSYLSGIGRIENSFCSACRHSSQDISHLILHCPATDGLFAPLTLWRLSVSLRPLVQALESCPASGASWSSAMPPSLRRSRATTTITCEDIFNVVDK